MDMASAADIVSRPGKQADEVMVTGVIVGTSHDLMNMAVRIRDSRTGHPGKAVVVTVFAGKPGRSEKLVDMRFLVSFVIVHRKTIMH